MNEYIFKLPVYSTDRNSILFELEIIVDKSKQDLILTKRWELQYIHNTWRVFTRTKDRKIKYLYNFILNPTGDQVVDHINHNCLDNRLINLRLLTKQQNQFNKRASINSTSKFKGVSWDRRLEKWKAQIKLNNKNYNIGHFDSELEAAQAYNNKAKELHGEFACLN